jgi:hypothetical protein
MLMYIYDPIKLSKGNISANFVFNIYMILFKRRLLQLNLDHTKD